MHYKSLYPPLPPVEDQNLHDFIFGSIAQRDEPEDKLQLLNPVTLKKWTKSQFRERVTNCTTALVTPESQGGLGLSYEGEMVAIMSTNCMEYITLVHSLFKIAVPFALIPASSTAFELQHLFRTSEATRLFVHPDILPQALEVAQLVGLPQDRIYILEGHVEGRRNLASAIDAIHQRKLPAVPTRPVVRNTLAYLVFSSGTSGLPKAVMISQHNVLASLKQVQLAGEYEGADPLLQKIPPVNLGFLPIYHTYGLHYVCIRPIWSVTPTIVIPKWNVDTVLELIPRYRISILTLTPPAMLQLVNHKRAKDTDFSSVVFTGSGAAHMPPKLARTYKSLLQNVEHVGEGYGMSEMTISGTRTAHAKFGGPKSGSCGVLLPGIEAKIVRDDGTLAGPNEPGELWLYGPNIAMGYWRNDKATKETFVDNGWVRSGDRFRVDADQHFFFVERTKDILKVSGAQVSPTEIENVLLAQPEKLILDVTVAGVSGGRTSDEKVPRAWVVLSDEGKQRGSEEVVQALHTWIQKNLSKYKWLRGGIEVLDEIPKNPTGKVLRRVLQDRFEQAQKLRAKL
ncbi:acetyl-CoA synthetase-like protein [Lenzites betulinus]|nr:acetyl-CoA synthetase-like protein [Lenzites betulinus]